MTKRVIFISNSVIPQKDAGGGSVVIYRHLKKLEASGCKVVIIYLSNPSTVKKRLTVDFGYIIINKKPWYPPLRRKTPLLTSVRMYLSMSNLNKRFKFDARHDLLLCTLGEVSNLLARMIKRRFKIPYFLFYHDDTIFNRYALQSLLTAKNTDKILKEADFIFPVSDMLTGLLKTKGIYNAETLYPLPGGYSGPFKTANYEPAGNLQLLVAGMVEHIHFNTLKSIGKAVNDMHGKFHCVADLSGNDIKEVTEGGYVTVIPRFAANEQLFSFIISTIDILVVFYSFDVQHEPRMMTSFPSKLAEYCHLQLPVLIVAPRQSTLGIWAVDNNWLSYVDSDDPRLIYAQLQKLKDIDYFNKCRRQSAQAAMNVFSPAVIHQQFAEHLPVS